MNKKVLSTVIVLSGILLLVLSLVLFLIDKSGHNSCDYTYCPYNLPYGFLILYGGIYMYMIIAGIVLILGGIIMRFLKNIPSIILSFVGIDLFLLPIFLTMQKFALIEANSGEFGIIGGADLPTFMLFFRGINLTVSEIGLVLVILAFILSAKLTKKK